MLPLLCLHWDLILQRRRSRVGGGDHHQLVRSCMVKRLNDHLLREIYGKTDNEETYLSCWMCGGVVDEAPASLFLSTTSFLSHSMLARNDFIGGDYTMVNRNARPDKKFPYRRGNCSASNLFNYDRGGAQQCTITVQT